MCFIYKYDQFRFVNITNFRKLKKAELKFQPGLNIMVGANNAGKTAVVDALRVLLRI